LSTSWRHALASASEFGGKPDDYIKIHELIDGSKQSFGDVRHRALLHNTWGVWLVQEVFGRTITVETERGTTRDVPVREVAEHHIMEDLGFIPSPGDWLEHMNIVTWMGGKRHRFVGREEVLNNIVKEGKK
jgi:hypothetical protein